MMSYPETLNDLFLSPDAVETDVTREILLEKDKFRPSTSPK